MIGLMVLSNGVFLLESVGGHETWITVILVGFFLRVSLDTFKFTTLAQYPLKFYTTTRWWYVVWTNVGMMRYLL